MGPAISQACRDKIVEFEVGSRAYYERFAKNPVWPGGMSGITIGVGYDLGQHTAAQFQADWINTYVDRVPSLLTVCGHTGANAKWLLHTVESVVIPYDAAIDVFDRVILPRYIGMTMRAFPNCERLPQDAFGALVDLVYNRGGDTSAVDDRRAEMRAIKLAMTSMHVSAVPGYLRSMKRLWPNSKALLARREWEAATFEHAITQAVQDVSPIVHTSPDPAVRHPIIPSRRPSPVPVASHEDEYHESDDPAVDALNEEQVEKARRQR